MRLKCIKVAGFKSFVDPTTVSFPSNLCAIVGPNGCGKSNSIDAVRWVMGESSAKNLRGESMTDVIFNGSGGRKPVGQATVELVFDNSDGTLKGEYAGYSEISIKRKVTRDAQNSYYLNGTKCRRRDITDIFLGTGLGPRSYAIIEQGMISKLIESKPDELRVFIEEAAGISKYKERRRDTESRMRRTNENLERLSDIRDELERQLSRLERQSKAAEKYTEFKKDERLLKAQLQALRYRVLDEQAKVKQQAITELELKVESFVTDQLHQDTNIEKFRLKHTDLGDKFNDVQGRFYSVGADIARIEQTIAHGQERGRQLQVDLEQIERDCRDAEELLTQDKDKAEECEAELLEIEPELNMLKEAEEGSGESLQVSEEGMQEWQLEWDAFNQTAAEPRQRAEVQQSRIQHLEQVQTRLLERIRKFEDEKSTLVDDDGDDEVEELNEQLAELDMQSEDQRERIELIGDDLEAQHTATRESNKSLDQVRTSLQSMRGRHASLEALQQAALGEKNSAVSEWLTEQNWDQQPRLAEGLEVQGGWDKAVETVLGNSLQAVCVDDLGAVDGVLSNLTQGELILLETSNNVDAKAADIASPLASHVSSNSHVSALLAGVYAVADLSDALALRTKLQAHESVVTIDGIWLGANWLRVARDTDASSGVLARKLELEELTDEIETCEAQADELSDALEKSRESIKDYEQQREELRRAANDLTRKHSELRSQLSAKQVRSEQLSVRRDRVDSEILEAREQIDLESESLSEARMILEEAIESMDRDTDQRETLLNRRDDIRVKLDDARQRARHDKDKGHELAMRHQALKTQLDATRSNMARLLEQTERMQERREQLRDSLEETRDPEDDNKLELEELLEQRLTVEAQLAEARRALEQVEQDLRKAEQERNNAEQGVQGIRSRLETQRLEGREVEVQRANLLTLLEEENFHLPTLLAQLTDDHIQADMETELQAIAARVARLGPINLAAIEEYKTESERKNYLDAQNDELVEALETLAEAIRKIDRETRTKFKETYDQVNTGLQELFPKVFGGGHAYLELTGDDLLDTGIAIMARPPGKRNSTIHLLSGGEKALTAIALVFSIFRLNPAPFCMLDEVDAPLDDANVGRYARMVEEMSEHVQFIYITHNKIAMEMAHQLMGVTMHEPGVSRLVSVDVNEAAELASL